MIVKLPLSIRETVLSVVDTLRGVFFFSYFKLGVYFNALELEQLDVYRWHQ